MANGSEVLSKLFFQISESDRAAIGSELNVEDAAASFFPQGNVALKPDPAALAALLRRIDPTDQQISQLFESGIFETGFDLWDESDFEIVVSFDSPRERDGALPLTDIAIASLALTGLLESIVKAHQPFGLTLEMPVVLVFSGSYDAKTKKCPRAVSICMWVLLTVIPAIEPVVHATKWVVQTSTYVLTNRTDKQPLQKQSMLPDAQTRAVEADAALKAAQANLVEAQTKLVEAQTKGAEADAALKIAQANLIEAQTKLVEAQTKGAKADAASKEAQARLVEAEARAIEEGVKLNEAHAKFADAQSRIVEAQAAVRNAQVRPAETETTEAATTGDAAGDARIINEHPVSFYVSADKINEQAQYLGVEPAYIEHLLNRTWPAFQTMRSSLGDLTATISTVPKDKS